MIYGNFKTFESYIYDMVSQISYDDFSPHFKDDKFSYDWSELKKKLRALFEKYNTYWVVSDVPKKFSQTFDFEIKPTGINPSKHNSNVIINFGIFKEKINIYYFRDTKEGPVEGVNEFPISEVWMNHKIFYDSIITTFSLIGFFIQDPDFKIQKQ